MRTYTLRYNKIHQSKTEFFILKKQQWYFQKMTKNIVYEYGQMVELKIVLYILLNFHMIFEGVASTFRDRQKLSQLIIFRVSDLLMQVWNMNSPKRHL